MFATVSASGGAALGSLGISAMASTFGAVIGAGGSITASWNDTFTAVNGGNFLMTVNFSDSLSGACLLGGAGGTASDYFRANGVFEQAEIASWNNSTCSPNAAPYLYGNTNQLSYGEVQLTIYAPAGTSFTVSETAQVQVNTGYGQPMYYGESASASVADPFTIVGLDGATYTSASGTTYDAPEPPSLVWFCAALGLLVVIRRVRDAT